MASVKGFILEFLRGRGFKYLFWFRLNQYLSNKPTWILPVRLFARIILRRWSLYLGIDISLSATVGPGLKIEHFGTIFVNDKARIGKRCSILQGVTIGEHRGSPTVGDFVFIGPGSKLIGNISVGDNTIIGANAVLTKSVPQNAVVVGNPAKIDSLRGNLRDDGKTMAETLRLYRRLCPVVLLHRYGLDQSCLERNRVEGPKE